MAAQISLSNVGIVRTKIPYSIMAATSLAEELLSHTQDDHIHRQEQSYLFRLPPELRQVIYELAVTAYSDPSRPYDVNTHYCRPGHTHALRIDTELLQACRIMYLEARQLPLSCNTIVFWAYRGPNGEPATQGYSDMCTSIALLRLCDSVERPALTARLRDLGYTAMGPGASLVDVDEDDTPWQFARFRKHAETPIHLLKRAHWFTQQYWLECDNFMFAMESPEMANVEHLTLTIRRGDQWNFLDLQPIGIDPRWPAAVTEKRMKELWARDLSGVGVQCHPDAFGSHIRHLPKLKVLELELEGEVAQQEELVAIIEHAKRYWNFPHHSGQIMRADTVPRVEYWMGPPCLAAPRRTFQRVSEKAWLVKHTLTFRVSS
jgi:hypothetical protein